MISCQEHLRGMSTLMGKKFGILGAIAVGILRAYYFRNFESPKIRKNASAPFQNILNSTICTLGKLLNVSVKLHCWSGQTFTACNGKKTLQISGIIPLCYQVRVAPDCNRSYCEDSFSGYSGSVWGCYTCWGVSTPRSGLGLRMVKELDLQLALGMNERR